MAKRFRNIICFGLIAVQMLPLMIPAGLCLQKLCISWERKEEMEHASLQILKVRADDIQWYQFEEECRIAGRMFDVKSMKKAGDWIMLQGLYDDEETAIELTLENTTPSANDRERSAVILACVSVLSLSDPLESPSPLPPPNYGEWWLNTDCNIISFHSKIVSPPPET